MTKEKTIKGHNETSIVILSLLIDGIGLSIIAACTVLEGVDLWNDYFNEYWDNCSSSLMFWGCGRFLQMIGLFLLIFFALLNGVLNVVIHELESAGMLMLTAGPILNIISCSLFNNQVDDPHHLFNKQWISNESLELIGISILDISLIDMDEKYVLASEVIGFLVLMCAAIMEFEYVAFSYYPNKISARFDMIHGSDCFGLMLLTCVSFLQYHIKTSKHSQHGSQHGHSKSTIIQDYHKD